MFDAPVEFGDGLVDVRQRDDGRGEDPPVVVERPLLQQPFVVRVHRCVREFDVVEHPFLEHASGGREHDAGVQALLVEQGQPFVGPPERLGARNGVRQLAQRLALGVDPAEVVGPSTGRCDDLVGRIGNRVGQPALDHELGMTLDLNPLDRTAVALGQVAGVGVGRLVEMVVGVPDLAGRLGHGRTSSGV